MVTRTMNGCLLLFLDLERVSVKIQTHFNQKELLPNKVRNNMNLKLASGDFFFPSFLKKLPQMKQKLAFIATSHIEICI